MTADIELLPPPAETEGNPWIGYELWDVRKLQDCARAVAEHNVKKRDAEIEALRAEREVIGAEAVKYADKSGRLEAKVERLAEALRLIAAPKRQDGSWNRDREACRQIAAEALRDHDQEGKDG